MAPIQSSNAGVDRHSNHHLSTSTDAVAESFRCLDRLAGSTGNESGHCSDVDHCHCCTTQSPHGDHPEAHEEVIAISRWKSFHLHNSERRITWSKPRSITERARRTKSTKSSSSPKMADILSPSHS